ncbi:MAG TPA: LysR substrate-binding domain-containing protein [Kofleriaceae bacterium]|nr:LysR substrate-binding domain-containing protein [Kofleriaceae bacterium]
MIELPLLRYFVAVAETEHVGRAAARLHISQSPLSRQIRQLEDLLGVALFERERRRIRITEAGRWLLGPAREMLARGEALIREARDRGDGATGEIALGFVGAALASGVLPAALRRLRDERPRMHIVLRQLSSSAQLAQLRAGELDLALVHRQVRTGDLEEHRLLEQRYVLAVPRPGPLARGPVRPADLDGQPWILVGQADADRGRWLAAWAAAGFTPVITVDVVEWASALALVDAGIGLALVPESYATARPPGVAIRQLPWLRMTSGLSLVRRRGKGSPLLEEVARWIREAAGAPGPR